MGTAVCFPSSRKPGEGDFSPEKETGLSEVFVSNELNIHHFSILFNTLLQEVKNFSEKGNFRRIFQREE